MRLGSLILLGSIFSFSTSHADIPQTNGGSYLVPLEKYPAVVQIFNDSNSARCTATLIGANVIVTAAHCKTTDEGYFKIGKTRYNFTFLTYQEVMNKEDSFSIENLDLAVGIVSRDVKDAKPISINFTEEHGKHMIALGFGCSRHMLGETFSRIQSESDREYVLATNSSKETIFLCSGDSGGPTLAYDYDLKLRLTGIHLRSNIKSYYIDWKTSNNDFKNFIATVAETKNLKICDYNLECN